MESARDDDVARPPVRARLADLGDKMSDRDAPRTSFVAVPASTLGRRHFLAALGLTAAGGAAVLAGCRLGTGAAPAAKAPSLLKFAVPLDTHRHKRTWMAWPDGS